MGKLLFSMLISLCLFSAQAPDAPKSASSRVIGELAAIDAAGKKITIKADKGGEVTAVLTDKTVYKRIAPGETDASKATTIGLGDLSVGDRVRARGKLSEDEKYLGT